MDTIQKTRKHVILAALAAVCAGTVGAHADETATGVPVRSVHYADLNLNTQAGAAVLYKRIRQAADLVCGDADTRDLAQRAAAKACIERAIAASVRTVNKPLLTNVYNAHVGLADKQLNVASLR